MGIPIGFVTCAVLEPLVPGNVPGSAVLSPALGCPILSIAKKGGGLWSPMPRSGLGGLGSRIRYSFQNLKKGPLNLL